MRKTEGGHQHKQPSRDFSVCYVGSRVKTCFSRDWVKRFLSHRPFSKATHNNGNETRETQSAWVFLRCSPQHGLSSSSVHPHSAAAFQLPPWFYYSLRSPFIELIWAPFLASFTALISHASLAPIMRPSAARHILSSQLGRCSPCPLPGCARTMWT